MPTWPGQVAANRTSVPLAMVSVYWPGQVGVISGNYYHLSWSFMHHFSALLPVCVSIVAVWHWVSTPIPYHTIPCNVPALPTLCSADHRGHACSSGEAGSVQDLSCPTSEGCWEAGPSTVHQVRTYIHRVPTRTCTHICIHTYIQYRYCMSDCSVQCAVCNWNKKPWNDDTLQVCSASVCF